MKTLAWLTATLLVTAVFYVLLAGVLYELNGTKLLFWMMSLTQLLVFLLLLKKVLGIPMLCLLLVPFGILTAIWCHGELIVRSEWRVDISASFDESARKRVFTFLADARLLGLLNNNDTSGISVEKPFFGRFGEESAVSYVRRYAGGSKNWHLRRFLALPYRGTLDSRSIEQPIEVVCRYETPDQPIAIVFEGLIDDSRPFVIFNIAVRTKSSGVDTWPLSERYSNEWFYAFLRAYDGSLWAELYIWLVFACSCICILLAAVQFRKNLTTLSSPQ